MTELVQYCFGVILTALVLVLTSRAIIAAYFSRKETFVDLIVKKLKGADCGNKG